MKYITQIVRVFVGVLFILSGFVKLVDPKGFGYKLEEYFAPDVFNLSFLNEYALVLSVFFVILEVILGVCLLLGVFKKFTLYSLVGLIVFFTFLTFYSAFFNKVTDCGCFGDALKLKPWESFYKDLILLVLILILIIGQKYINPILPNKIGYALTGIALMISGYIAYFGINHLPMIDFRPFAVGVNIPKGMEIPPNAPRDSIAITFIYKHEGKTLEFNENQLGQIPQGAEFVDRKDVLIKEGFKPAIKADFQFDCGLLNKTDHFLRQEKLVVILVPIVNEMEIENWNAIKLLASDLQKENIQVVGAMNEVIPNSNFEICTMDQTMLKTVIRSNPGIMVLEKGTILAKYHYNDLPSAEEIKELF